MNVIDGSVTFALKNSYIFFALENSRQSLELVVYQVAHDTLIASHASLIASIPITCLLADVTVSCFKESVNTITELFCITLFPRKPLAISCPSANPIAFVVGYLAKAYFCTLAMPLVALTMKEAVICITPIAPGAPIIVAICAPALTFFAGEMIQDTACKKLCG